MKICIVSDAYYPYPSGVSEYIFYLAKYLRKRGHIVKILTTNYPNEKGVSDKEVQKDVFRVGRVFFLRANKSCATPTIGYGVSRIVKNFLLKESFDVLILGTPVLPPSLAFYALKHSRTKNIAVFFSTHFKFWNSGRKIFQFFFEKYRKKLNSLIAISPSARDFIKNFVRGDYKIIPCGVDFEIFNPEVKPIKKFSNIKGPKILYFGRLDKRKGLAYLLKAFPEVKKEFKGAVLIVGGRGPMEKECKKLAEKLNIFEDVFFEGFVERKKVPSFYASCDIYCSPALGGESFGIVLLEAMACKRPVIASKIVGYDFVIKDGFNGIFFDPGNISDLAKKIVYLLKNPSLREKISENALNFAKDYSWDKIAESFEGVILNIIKKGG